MSGIPQTAYDRVADEISSGEYKAGLQARAIAESSGDAAKTKARYIQLRAEEIFEAQESEQRQHSAAMLAADAPRRHRVLGAVVIGAIVIMMIFFLTR
jgi:hypothetical protein